MIKCFFAPLTDGDNWENVRTTGGKDLIYGVNATGCNDLNCSWFLNHSDDPSVMFVDAEEEGHFCTYETKRVIERGEELTIDYRELGEAYYKEILN